MTNNGEHAQTNVGMQAVAEKSGISGGGYGTTGYGVTGYGAAGNEGIGHRAGLVRSGDAGGAREARDAGASGVSGASGASGTFEKEAQLSSRPTLLEGAPAEVGQRKDALRGEAQGGKDGSLAEDSASQRQADEVPDSPEGYAFAFESGVEVDEQALEAFKEVAFRQGISQGQASQIAQLYATLVERQQEDQRATLEEAESGWLKELKHHRNYPGMVASARLAMERFGTPELNALLNETRLGSHPALVRFVASVGRELGEPVFVQGKGSGRPQRLNFYETMES